LITRITNAAKNPLTIICAFSFFISNSSAASRTIKINPMCPKREQDYQETQSWCNPSMRKKTLILYLLEQVGLLMEILSSLQKYQTGMKILLIKGVQLKSIQHPYRLI